MCVCLRQLIDSFKFFLMNDVDLNACVGVRPFITRETMMMMSSADVRLNDTSKILISFTVRMFFYLLSVVSGESQFD